MTKKDQKGQGSVPRMGTTQQGSPGAGLRPVLCPRGVLAGRLVGLRLVWWSPESRTCLLVIVEVAVPLLGVQSYTMI